MSMRKPVIGIVGVGLIGGSLGMCLCSRGGFTVIGWDESADSLDTAIQIGALSYKAESLSSLCTQSDVIFIATPISVALELLPDVLELARPDCIVSDVCSTKQAIVELSVESSKSSSPVFVGGHPMAGSERGGVSAADPYLFENALYVLTPSEKRWTEDERLSRAVSVLSTLVECTGARLAFLEPQEHDLMAAVVSHLPHVVAVALVQTLESYSKDHPAVSSMAAGGFRDATRVASGNPGLWRDILLSNAGNIAEVIDQFVKELHEIGELIRSGAGKPLTESLERAATIKNSLPKNLKGLTTQLFELVVAINDEPGKISTVTSIIAAEGVNIKDIEILKIREGEGGTLRLGFADDASCQAAQSMLSAHGFSVRRR